MPEALVSSVRQPIGFPRQGWSGSSLVLLALPLFPDGLIMTEKF